MCVCSVAQSCPTVCGPMDCSPSDSSVHRIFQVRMLEQAAIFYIRGSSRPRDRICISWCLLHWQVNSLPLAPFTKPRSDLSSYQITASSLSPRVCEILSVPFKSEDSISSAAAAAKSLQSCPILCDPIDGSPSGSTIPGILQARTLERVALSFSNAWKWKVKGKSLSHVQLLATPWTAAYQVPPSMGFSRQEYWSGVPLPSLSISSRPPKIKPNLPSKSNTLGSYLHSAGPPVWGASCGSQVSHSFGRT